LLGSRSPGSPTSLVNPTAELAADRRALRDVATAQAAPTTEPGFATRCHRWLHVEIDVKDGTSMDYQVWLKRTGMSEQWSLDTRVGTAGTGAALASGSPVSFILEIDGVDRVFIRLLNPVGGPTTGTDVWLGSSGEV